MIDNKTVLAIIPARGGSKGLPRKNILEVNGKPLLAWTIETAKKSHLIDRLILSSEDDEIISTAHKWGCEVPFRRPPELAGDETSSVEVVLHAANNLDRQYDYIVLLQPTSPLRTAEDIDSCIEKCHHCRVPSCVTITESEKNPAWMFHLDQFQHLQSVQPPHPLSSRRQDYQPVYVLNGAVYVVEWEWFKKNMKFIDTQSIGHIMPRDRSLDIDTLLDFNFFQYLATTTP